MSTTPLRTTEKLNELAFSDLVVLFLVYGLGLIYLGFCGVERIQALVARRTAPATGSGSAR